MRFATANDIINRAALEVGLLPSSDAVADSDETYVQLTGLLTSAGQELVELHPWEILQKSFDFTTQSSDSGDYNLPDDFCYMIDQTGWDRTNRVAIGGPLSSQDWAYLAGRDLVSQTIYVSFQLSQNQFKLFPQPPPDGVQVAFTYINRNWVQEQGQTSGNRASIGSGSDIVLYEPILIVKFLKAKFLEAKGFDASSARLEFENMFVSRTGKDEGAPILSASSSQRGFPYLSPYYNTGDTGFGIP